MSATSPDPLATVFFLSDYGLQDEFVGVIKAVLRHEAPNVTVIDLSHEIPPCNVRAGARMLERAAPFAAPGIFLAVVDPGVGSARRAIAIATEPPPTDAPAGRPPAGRPQAGTERTSVLVGPDNGLLIPAARSLGSILLAVQLHETGQIPQRPDTGPTFAGRDLFAPAVARIANGTPLRDLGSVIDPSDLHPGPPSVLVAAGSGALTAEVLWEDRFGNLQLAATPSDLPEPAGTTGEVLIRIPGGRPEPQAGGADRSGRSLHQTAGRSHQAAVRTFTARRVRTFTEIPTGKIGLLVDSYGKLTLACRESSASAMLAVHAGEKLHISPVDPRRSNIPGAPG